MKPITYYTTQTLSYPCQEDFTTVFAYSRGQVLWQGPARDWHDVKRTLPPHTVEKVVDDSAYRAARTAYRAEQGRLQEEFKRDLFEEHGVTDHPKAERCYALAWEKGHSAGLQEVANFFDDFVDLIKD